MNRDYESGQKSDVIFFIGNEIEHTPAFGLKTLFVVGLQPFKVILTIAQTNQCSHIYLGANQSFNLDQSITTSDTDLYQVIDPWDKLATELLAAGFTVTLDFDVRYVQNVAELTCNEHDNFIPQVSVKIPYARQLNYNTTIKIDDNDFAASNPGVWCHSLHTLLDPEVFTSWREYKKDKTL